MSFMTKSKLSASVDSVSISDGTDTLAINADGSINAVVTATDLDIRDLVNTQDSVAIGDETNLIQMQQEDAAWVADEWGFPIFGVRQDAGGSPVSADGDAHPLVFNSDGELKVAADLNSDIADDAADSGNPVKIGGRGVDGALTALSASNDRFDLLGDLYRRVWVNNAPNVGTALTREVVGTTVSELVSTPSAGRTRILVQNRGTASVYLGIDGTVTADDAATGGIELQPCETIELPYGEDLNVHAISGSAGQNVFVMELG